jgi:hypothetical protein
VDREQSEQLANHSSSNRKGQPNVRSERPSQEYCDDIMRPTSRQFKLSWQEQLDVASVADSDGQHGYEGADRHLREAQSAGAIQVSHVRDE